MALLNYLSDGIYAIIDDVNYYKGTKLVEFKLLVYADQSKSVLLAEKPMRFDGIIEVRYLEDIHVKRRPKKAAVGTRWAIAEADECDDPDDPQWKERAGLVACVAQGDGEPDENNPIWVYESVDPVKPYYAKSLKKFFKKKDNGPWIEVSNPQSEVTWDKFFSAQAISDPKTNIYQQIYEWLKTQPGFENTRDA
jgi:hypothetical protein